MATPEGLKLKAICQYLSLQEKLGHGTWWKVRSMTFNANRQTFMKLSGPLDKTGIPDIEGVYLGRFCGIEVKSDKGRQSVNQKRFQSDIEKNGGIYILAYDVIDVINMLESIHEMQKLP